MAKKGQTYLRIICLVAIIMVITLNAESMANAPALSVSDSGYSSGFQGPKAKFYGIQANTYGSGDIKYSKTNIQSGASLKTFDTVLRFDPDGASTGYPNLIGEQTTVFIPRESLGSIPSWLPSSWMNTMSYIQNPQATYEWTVGDNKYYMEQWLLRYYVSLSAEWDGSIQWDGGHGEIPPAQAGITENNFPSDTELWIEFNLEPTWYIQGQGTAYFAIGKVQLADSVQYKAGDVNGNEVGQARTEVSISPESQAAVAYLYYEPWGEGAVQTHESSYYQGKQLNPELFTDKVYMRIDLNRFGVYSGNQVLGVGYWCKGDTVKIAFDMTVFVVGQWDTKDVQYDPDDFGRFERTSQSSDFFTWLLSKETLVWLIPVLILGAIIFFAPWLLVLIISAFK